MVDWLVAWPLGLGRACLGTPNLDFFNWMMLDDGGDCNNIDDDDKQDE